MITIGSYQIIRLLRHGMISPEDYKKKMSESEVVEMQALLEERYYDEIAGRILLPMGA